MSGFHINYRNACALFARVTGRKQSIIIMMIIIITSSLLFQLIQ